MEHEKLLDQSKVKNNSVANHILMKWKEVDDSDASLEDYYDFMVSSPSFNFKDKVVSQEWRVVKAQPMNHTLLLSIVAV